MMLYWLVQLVKRGGISWGEGLRIYREKEVPSVAKKKISELSKPSITWGRKNGGGGGGGGVCRLCFDSPHPLIFVLQDASGLMGGIKTKSTATPPPPTIFLPQAMLGSLCHQFSFFSTWGPVCRLEKRESKYTLPWYRAVIQRRGPRISPGYYACGPRLLS